MTCLLVEDEPLARLRLSDYIRKVPFLIPEGVFESAEDALPALLNRKPDLLFLDIEMDGLSGLELLAALPYRPAVILTTAYDQYALRGFELGVADYLLKPYTFERFLQAVLRVKEAIAASREYFFVKTEYRLQKVDFSEILFIEGMRDYRRLHLTASKIMTLETFGDLERQLPAGRFCRVHKSYLVALDRVESIERDRIRIGAEYIPVSDTYREDFYRKIGRPAK